MEAGKHVLVEKPIAMSLGEAHSMIDTAKANDRLLMVGHLLNYHSAFLRVVEMVESGKLGPLRRIYSNRLSFGKVRVEEDVLWSFAPHDLSMILRLAGGRRLIDVKTSSSDHVTPGLADLCHVHMTFENNLSAHTFVSWLHPFKEQKLVVIGQDAMVVFDDTQPFDRKVCLYEHRIEIVDGLPELEKGIGKYENLIPSEPLREECLAFLIAMRDGTSVYSDGEEGLRVLEVLTRAQEQMATSNGATSN